MQHLILDIFQIIRIGKTYEKRDILVAKIGQEQPYAKPAIFFEAGKTEDVSVLCITNVTTW